jgi:hypothetical protein
MFRKIILGAVLALAAVTGFTISAGEVNAQPLPLPHRRHHVHYEVLIRHRHHWDSYATYHDVEDARRAAFRLRARGYEVRIEREFVR